MEQKETIMKKQPPPLLAFELVLWVVSFFWVFVYFFNTAANSNFSKIYCVWIAILWLGLCLVYFFKRAPDQVQEHSSSDEQHTDANNIYDGDKLLKPTTIVSLVPLNRIFGANKSSFRYICKGNVHVYLVLITCKETMRMMVYCVEFYYYQW